MTIGYALLAYLLPVAAICGGLLLARDYGYATCLEILAAKLLREAARSRDRHARNAVSVRAQLEELL